MKVYEKIEDIFKDDILSPKDILIIWGKRGKGKSSLAGFFMSEFMRPKIAKQDIKASKELCAKLREVGYPFYPPDDHLVFCDTFFERTGFLSKRSTAYKFNALDFCLPNEIHHPSCPICPHGKYFFDEAQDLFDSHNASLPTFVTKTFELSRQIEIFTAIISQRPMRIHKDIRDLATFVEVVDMKNKYGKYGNLKYSEWTCYIIKDNAVLEKYLTTKDKDLIDIKVKFRFRGNIFKCYDSNYFLPMFFKGFENTQFIFDKGKRTEFSQEGFKNYYKNRLIDIPETYRGKVPKESKKNKNEGESNERK